MEWAFLISYFHRSSILSTVFLLYLMRVTWYLREFYSSTSRSGVPWSIGWIRHPTLCKYATSDIINLIGFLFISMSVVLGF